MRFTIRISRIFFICVFAAGYSSAQDNFIRFDHLSIKDGLSQSSINAIFQDSKGFMWLCTQDGLNKFDGYNFEIYYHDPFDSTTLSDNFINAIYEDSLGFLWIGTDNGLSKFDTESGIFQRYAHNPDSISSLSDNNVWAIQEDRYGILWIGTANGGLNAFDRKTGKFKNYRFSYTNKSCISSNSIRCIFEDSKGTLWIGTVGGGLNIYDRNSDSFVNIRHNPAKTSSLCNDFVWTIYEDDKQRLWVGTNNGLSCLPAGLANPGKHLSPEFVNFRYSPDNPNGLSNNVVRAVYQDRYGAMWVGTDGGGLSKLLINQKNLSKSSFIHYKHEPYIKQSIGNNLVQCLYEDRSGSMWVGTNSGLNRFDPKKQSFVHYQHIPYNPNSLNDNTVWSIFEDSDKILWVGTRAGLNRIDRKNNQFTAYGNISNSPHFLNNKSILSIYQNSKGSILIGSVDGLFRLQLSADKKTVLGFVPVNYSDEYFKTGLENRVYVIYEDAEGYLWVGTKNGLGRISPDGKSHIFIQNQPGNPESLSDNTIRAIFQSSKGTIWIGTESGLNKVIFNVEDSVRFKHYKHVYGSINTLSNNMILSIWESDDGILWLGTYGGGLNRFVPKTESFCRYTEKEGLSNNVIYSVLGDKEGFLWLSTNRGISQFNPYNETFKNYEENDGLQSNEFNIGASHYNKNGELFFGGINGFNVFHPKQVEINPYPPEMAITGFRLFDSVVKKDKSLSFNRTVISSGEVILDHKEDNFSIEFAALHYTFPEKNRYQYKLVGFDDDFINAGHNRSASYTNLDPGEYLFIVKGANSDGIWSEKTASLKIIVTPPYWKTWWFRLLIIVAVAGLIYAFYRNKVNRIHEQKILLEEQVRERTAEVTNQKEKIELQKVEIEKEKEKAEALLSNILPQETVEELKLKGKASARHYRTVSVMFTDVKNFTQIAENLRPQEIVAALDSYFIKYDEIIEKNNIEKIKTMGDSYMCAGGIPIRNRSNPFDIVLAGLEIQYQMKEMKKIKLEKGEPNWEVRIGIHTGELTAGVIGIKRFAYDIWGDTVNIANRMETSGEVEKVNISGETYSYIKNFFDCTYRGKIQAKHKGEIDMYFVERINPELSEDEAGFFPNDMFWEYVNLELYSSINYMKSEKYIHKILYEQLSDKLTYHHVHHTLDVCNATERIAKAEGIKGTDLFLLKTAALYHDAGFVKEYYNNEPIGAKMAQEALTKFGYTPEQIEVIESLILATKLPQDPKNHLENIICDADLDYLGRDDFHPIADTLKDEFIAHGIAKDEKHWDEIQIGFLEKHHYFTESSRKSRTEIKEAHLAEIKKRYGENNYGKKKTDT